MDNDDFVVLNKIANIVTPPPDKVVSVKPSKKDLLAYYHDGLVLPKPLPIQYSLPKIRKAFKEEYHDYVNDIFDYKGNRGYLKDKHKKYNVVDMDDGHIEFYEKTIFELGQWLESKGDYDLRIKSKVSEKYFADVHYKDWIGPPKHLKPIDRSLFDVFIEEQGNFINIYDEEGNYLLRKKKNAEGTQIVRKDYKS